MFPLPDGWSALERVEDTVDADGARLHRVGLASGSAHGEAVGSAADWRSAPVDRAGYELLERVALLEAASSPDAPWIVRDAGGNSTGVVRGSAVFPASSEPGVWAHARSNGVALHSNWKAACEHAAQELIERDRTQRAWLGEIVPTRLPLDVLPEPLSATRSYDWCAYAFPPGPCDDPRFAVVGVFGFPRTAEAPLVFGYGCRGGGAAVAAALQAAISEAAQLLAFLWGEPIPRALPEPGPTAGAHLERFQFPPMHAHLRRWLAGDHTSYRLPSAAPAPTSTSILFVDLTPSWFPRGLCVARAMSDARLPLTFGRAPIFGHLPHELRMHPIP